MLVCLRVFLSLSLGNISCRESKLINFRLLEVQLSILVGLFLDTQLLHPYAAHWIYVSCIYG